MKPANENIYHICYVGESAWEASPPKHLVKPSWKDAMSTLHQSWINTLLTTVHHQPRCRHMAVLPYNPEKVWIPTDARSLLIPSSFTTSTDLPPLHSLVLHPRLHPLLLRLHHLTPHHHWNTTAIAHIRAKVLYTMKLFQNPGSICFPVFSIRARVYQTESTARSTTNIKLNQLPASNASL